MKLLNDVPEIADSHTRTPEDVRYCIALFLPSQRLRATMSRDLIDVSDALPKKHGLGNRRDWETRLVDASFVGDVATVARCLRNEKVNVNFQDSRCWTALHGAGERTHNRSFQEKRKHREIMSLLLGDPRINPALRTWRGESPLDFVERRGFDFAASTVRTEAEKFELRDMRRVMGVSRKMMSQTM